MSENNTFLGRMKRYTNVSTSLGTLITRFASHHYLGTKLDDAAFAESIKSALGELKGPLMKIAQILATIPDMVPPEYVHEFTQLQANAPPMGWLFVRKRMQNELGPNWQNHFQDFSQKAQAAASLGQVHQASLTSGQQVACKLQYPNMAAAVEADLNQFKVLTKIYQYYNEAIKTQNIEAEIGERLREELDYELEATRMRWYRHMLVDNKDIHIPVPIAALSTKCLLTMTWLEGDPLLSLRQAPQEVRNRLAKLLFTAWYKPFYKYGIIHGDPHLGNYTVAKDHTLNLLDFGCIRVFTPAFIEGVLMLFEALRNANQEQAAAAYEIWGFENLNKDLIEALNSWAEYLYRPLFKDKVQPIAQNLNSAEGRQIAVTVHKRLRELGGVRPPREFVFMDRAAVGLGSVFMHLRAELNWQKLFYTLVDDFNVSKLHLRQTELFSTKDR